MQKSLFYKSVGEGDTIVILHGLFGSGDNWVSVARSLSDKYHIVLPDLRNHGESFHDPLMNYDIMSTDVYQLCKDLNLEKFVLIGHSMGGKVAMAFAEKYPEMLKKLIIADIAPISYKGHHNDIFEAMFRLQLSKMSRRSEIEDELAKSIDDFGIRQFILKNIKNENKEYRWKLDIQSIYSNYKHLLVSPEIKENSPIEALFLKGEFSNYVSNDSEMMIKKYYPNSIIQIISGSGHWLHAENPKEFIEKSITFINK
jgi:esterase